MFNFYWFYPQKSQSHFLICLCVVISIFGFILPGLKLQFWLHSNVFDLWIFAIISQSLLFQFFHSEIFHLLFNLYFLYIAGPEVEARMNKNQFFYFFIFTTIFCVISLWIFTSNSITIGISGFCLALLAYIVLDLYSIKHHSFVYFAFLLAFNLSTWIIISGISFVWHLAWAVSWMIWWHLQKKLKFFKK